MAIELPLFPLNTVLFPGMPLQLHIFEERYKKMIQRCLEEQQPFGVVLIRRGREALGPLAEPHPVGCTARIFEVEHLGEGQMNITALGQQRFRILSLNTQQPYLVGEVEMFPLQPVDPAALAEHSRRLLPLVRRYMEILSQASEVSLDPEQLPDDPLVLAYLSAVLLQIPAQEKQDFLAAEKAVDLLANIHGVYQRELALLPALVASDDRRNMGQFSQN